MHEMHCHLPDYGFICYIQLWKLRIRPCNSHRKKKKKLIPAVNYGNGGIAVWHLPLFSFVHLCVYKLPLCASISFHFLMDGPTVIPVQSSPYNFHLFNLLVEVINFVGEIFIAGSNSHEVALKFVQLDNLSDFISVSSALCSELEALCNAILQNFWCPSGIRHVYIREILMHCNVLVITNQTCS